MDNQIMIDKPFAEIKEIDNEAGQYLRVWCDMYPNVYSLQIRATNSLKYYSNGKARNLIATVSVTIEELETILAEMKSYRDHQPSVFGNRDEK